jgi:hypothetical protein
MPFAIAQFNLIPVVVTIELRRKRREMHAVRLPGIAVGLFDLADHARIHQAPPEYSRLPAEPHIPGYLSSGAGEQPKSTARFTATVLNEEARLSGVIRPLPTTPHLQSRGGWSYPGWFGGGV